MPRNHPHLTASIDRGKTDGWTCRSPACPPCVSRPRCAREAALYSGAKLISELRQFGLLYKTIAGDAHTDRSNICRWAGGDEPRLGLSGLLAVIHRMERNLDKTRECHLTMATPGGSKPVKTIDFAADHGHTDALKDRAGKAVLSNVRQALLDRSAAGKEPLPDGCRAVLAQLGDPNFNLWIVQVADADCVDDDDASIQILGDVIHELDHITKRLKARKDRLEDRRDCLSGARRLPDAPTLRLS